MRLIRLKPLELLWRRSVSSTRTFCSARSGSSFGGSRGLACIGGGSLLAGGAATAFWPGGDAAPARTQTARNPNEDAECRRLGLMPPLEAQRTKVVRIKGFLDEEELETLQKEIRTIQSQHLAGEIERDKHEQVKMLGVWKTTYLHTDGMFRERLGRLHSKFREAMFRVDKENWNMLGKIPADRLNFRTVECHEYREGGRLVEEKHYDAGSFITMDVMLADPGVDFDGGEFVTPEADGSLAAHEFQRGDAVFFVSHKYHRVRPVDRGKRQVVVAELWEGPEKECAHRCLTPGPCDYSLSRSQVAAAGQHIALLG